MYSVPHDPEERYNILEKDERVPSYCGRFGFVHVNGNPKEVPPEGLRKDRPFVQFFCKRWDCAVCGRMKALLLKDRIEALTHEKGLKMMLTLTTDPSKARELQPDMGVNEYVTHVWNKTSGRLRYHWPAIKYLWMKEYHKERDARTGELNNPYPHLHVLTTDVLTEEDESKVMRLHCRAGGGNQVDLLEAKDSNEIRRYITKYITKTAQETAHGQVGRGRIWGRSKGMKTIDEIAKAAKPKDPAWILVKEYLFKGEISLDKWGNLCYASGSQAEEDRERSRTIVDKPLVSEGEGNHGKREPDNYVGSRKEVHAEVRG